ncbi:MAG: hypothetical protein D8H91_02800 [Alloprevotella sp.]|nr:MAG: hypothetical protein D8H91_02800 [Alloprevotella sp.]
MLELCHGEKTKDEIQQQTALKKSKTAPIYGIKQEKHKIIAFFDTFSLQFQSYIVTLHLMGRG